MSYIEAQMPIHKINHLVVRAFPLDSCGGLVVVLLCRRCRALQWALILVDLVFHSELGQACHSAHLHTFHFYSVQCRLPRVLTAPSDMFKCEAYPPAAPE